MKKTQQKTSKDDTAPWMKWAYVGIALIVAVAMVGTYLAPMFEKKPTAQVGNAAVIDYTIFSEDGRPLITTDQNLLASEYEKGNGNILLTQRLEMAVGGLVSGENIAVLPVVHPPEVSDFGLLGFETNAISAGLVGMQAGETRTISFSYGGNDFEKNLSEEDIQGLGFNLTDWEAGELILLGLTATPDIPLGNETNETPALRFGEVIGTTSDSVTIKYRYGSARVTLNGITG